MRVEGERQKAEVRVEGERQKAEEQHKRRRVQLALAGLVLFVAVGGGIAANRVQAQRDADGIATEKQRSDDQLAAEKQRADDRFGAEEQRQATQRQTRADALVDALTSADTAGVPRLIDDLKEYRDLTGPKLRELASRPVTTKPGRHARLALLADEPAHAAVLAVYLPACRPDELLPVVQLLKPHAGGSTSGSR